MIAVVHLVWGPVGVAPLRQFLTSYAGHAPGADHELVVLFNGVAAEQREELAAELAGVDHSFIDLDPPGVDLAAYLFAAERLPHDRLCFLNSYSVILADRWLAKLDDALSAPGAGLVGATGSWGSFRSAALNRLNLPNPYRATGQPRGARQREIWGEIERDLEQVYPGRRGPGVATNRAADAFRSLRRVPDHLLRFDAFPAEHIRTNAFLVDRELLRSLRAPPLRDKDDAVRFESGRRGLTRQVQSRGLRALLVADDGTTYDEKRWPQARTFWQGQQERLLIADNQTLAYARGRFETRRLLSARAWGPFAAPEPPLGE